MKFCTNCGKELNDDALVCDACGFTFEDAAEAPEAPAEPAAPAFTAPAAPAYAAPVNTAPIGQLKTNRGLIKFILLSVITFGIYGLVQMSGVSSDINTIASRYDGKKTMHYCLVVFIFSWLTAGIVPLVWMHKISARIGAELDRRNLSYSFGAGTFWLWGILGLLLFGIGPFVYFHKLFKAMNTLAADYNVKG